MLPESRLTCFVLFRVPARFAGLLFLLFPAGRRRIRASAFYRFQERLLRAPESVGLVIRITALVVGSGHFYRAIDNFTGLKLLVTVVVIVDFRIRCDNFNDTHRHRPSTAIVPASPN